MRAHMTSALPAQNKKKGEGGGSAINIRDF